jgi:hypothetical protein
MSAGGFRFVKSRRRMADVARREQIAASKVLDSFAHQNAVHNDVAAGAHVLREEFMLGLHIGEQGVIIPQVADDFALLQIGERYEGVVSRVDPQNLCVC